MVLVEQGKKEVTPDPALRAAWWWSLVVNTWNQIRNIREAAQYDHEKIECPREYWLDNKKVEQWFNDRQDDRNRRNGVLD